eukprot:11269825-Alexandrium_andersonii.AAC.1
MSQLAQPKPAAGCAGRARSSAGAMYTRAPDGRWSSSARRGPGRPRRARAWNCLLYTSDAADDM